MPSMSQLYSSLAAQGVTAHSGTYVRFGKSGAELTHQSGTGLEQPEAAEAFRRDVIDLLWKSQPKNSKYCARPQWKEQSQQYADVLLRNVRDQGPLSAGRFVGMCSSVAAIQGPEGIERALLEHEERCAQEAAALATERLQDRLPTVVYYGLMMEDGRARYDHPLPAPEPCKPAELKAWLQGLKTGEGSGKAHDPMMDVMMFHVQRDASLGPVVLDFLDEALAGGPGSEGDLVSGLWPASAMLALNLHPDALRNVFMTSDQVRSLAMEAWMGIGGLGRVLSPESEQALDQKIVNASSPREIAALLSEVADRHVRTAEGRAQLGRLVAALTILQDNANWLDAFERWSSEQPAQLQLQLQGRPLQALRLQYPLSETTEPARIGFFPPTGQQLLMLTSEPPATAETKQPARPSETKEPPSAKPAKGRKPARDLPSAGSVPPVVVHAAEKRAIEKRATEKRAAEKQAPPAASVKQQQGQPQAGSKLKQPGEHHHNSNKNLPAAEKELRGQTWRGRARRILGRFETWSPEAGDAVREARRQRAGLGVEGASTSRLVTQDFYE